MDFSFVNDIAELQQISEDLVSRCIAKGAKEAEVSISESVSLEVEVRLGVLDNVEINRTQDMTITAYVNGSVGHANIGDLSTTAMVEGLEKALAIARLSSSDPYAGLAKKELMATKFPDLELYYPWDIDVNSAADQAKCSEESAWSVSDLICKDKSEGAGVSHAASLSAYANSHGFNVGEKRSQKTISCSAVAEQNHLMETDSWSETKRNPHEISSPEILGRIAGERTVRRLGAQKIGDCQVPVLFLAPTAHTLIRHFIGAASGGSLYRKTSWLLGRLNQTIFAPHICIQEQPLLKGKLASSAYDNDGVSTQERDIIIDGKWLECFLSAYSARKLNMEPTGNSGGVHNLDIKGKTMTQKDLIRDLHRGLIVTDLMGQGVNPMTGDYSRGAAGFWVEQGEIVHPVNEITIAGNISQMLQDIVAVGDDSLWQGSIKCGSMLVSSLIVGGNK